MTDSERNTAVVTGRLFVQSYISLASESLEAGDYLFKCRPKLHHLLHIVEDIQLPGHLAIHFATLHSSMRTM